MKPVLYAPSETSFASNGLGILSDCVSCHVTEERNEGFELELQCRADGLHVPEIQNRCIILAKPSPGRSAEPFRIYRSTKPSKGVVTFYAQHISYDLSGIPIAAFAATTAAQAMTKLNTLALTANPFTFSTDVSKTADFASLVPASVRSLLGGKEGSILDVYHGEWLYEGFSVKLKAERGQDNGVTLRYGKNIQTLQQDENINDVYTGVLAYYYTEENGLVQGQIQNVQGSFDYVKILPYDATDKFDNTPSVADLNAEAIRYIADNDVGKPVVSLDVSLVELSKASGFEHLAPLNTVELCDTVTVIFEKLGISEKAKVVKTEYDVLQDKYTSITLGDAKESIADTIAEQTAQLKTAPTKTAMQQAIAYATKLITGNLGGYVLMHDSNGDGSPDEILIMNTPSILTATKIWRWNLSGLGYSDNGYAGPFGLAMTMDGSIVANYVNSGTLNAENVNVTNINGENIKGKTIGETPMKDGAISYGKTSSGVQSTLTQVGINSASIDSLSASLASFRTALASAITTGSLTINQPSFYYNGRKVTLVGLYDANGTYRECLGF